MTAIREFRESPLHMGKNEKIAYPITVPSSWGTSPTSPTCKIYNLAGVDLSSTKLSGSASVSGSVITTPLVQALEAKQQYKLVITWTDSGNTLECFGFIFADD